MELEQAPTAEGKALQGLAAFPLMEALLGRRSRRFALGDEIPDGPLAYRSRQQPLSLTELERMLVLSAMGGTTGWHYSITRNARYAPHASNYAGGAAGRTFPRPPVFTPPSCSSPTTGGSISSRRRRRRARRSRHRDRDSRAHGRAPSQAVTSTLRRAALPPGGRAVPRGAQHLVRELPGSLLVIPVADIAQHLIAILCFFAENGYAIYDDVNTRKIPGLDAFADWSTSRSLSTHVRRAVRDHRGHRRTRHRLLRRRARGPGDRARRLDVRRDRPLLDARRLGQP